MLRLCRVLRYIIVLLILMFLFEENYRSVRYLFIVGIVMMFKLIEVV